MNHDVVDLLRGALKDFGREDLINGNLDNQSTITINIDNKPSINITADEEDGNTVMLWATLAEYNEATLQHIAPDLVKLQLDAVYAQFGVGQPALQKSDANLELVAALKPQCLESKENLGAALEHFFNHTAKVQDLLTK
ncbi:hypothetical protein [Streptomyces sp. NPDC127112]|uniref:InvB/SpaK family type III secretion system chaperone n=1 Tax=Streptomyces sp. NPDC127112 TaxID=3345364 RepID=UPI00364022A8